MRKDQIAAFYAEGNLPGPGGVDEDLAAMRQPADAPAHDAATLVLQVQTVPEAAPRRSPRRRAHICLKCWEAVVPLTGRDDLVGGFGHRPECADRGIDPTLDDLSGRWLYAEPDWDLPVVLCQACGQAVFAAVGEDENITILPAVELFEWEWLQWLCENPETQCWECHGPLPPLSAR